MIFPLHYWFQNGNHFSQASFCFDKDHNRVRLNKLLNATTLSCIYWWLLTNSTLSLSVSASTSGKSEVLFSGKIRSQNGIENHVLVLESKLSGMERFMCHRVKVKIYNYVAHEQIWLHWGKSRNVTTASWQVTLCNSIPFWHVSSHSAIILHLLAYLHVRCLVLGDLVTWYTNAAKATLVDWFWYQCSISTYRDLMILLGSQSPILSRWEHFPTK